VPDFAPQSDDYLAWIARTEPAIRILPFVALRPASLKEFLDITYLARLQAAAC
jgi:hypothetical protein